MKCRKSWFAQGSSGRRVTLLPGTTFLHINGNPGGGAGGNHSLLSHLQKDLVSTVNLSLIILLTITQCYSQRYLDISLHFVSVTSTIKTQEVSSWEMTFSYLIFQKIFQLLKAVNNIIVHCIVHCKI